jgi:hypothetical protein
MNKNRISESIPAEVLNQAAQKLQEVQTLLAPYLKGLTMAERRDLPKMSNKTFTFVSKSAEYCHSYPQFVPGYLNVAELNRDLSTAAALRPVLDACTALQSDVDDTVMLAGSEALMQSLVFYSTVRTAAKGGENSAKPIYEDLSARFPGRRKRNDSDTSTPQA